MTTNPVNGNRSNQERSTRLLYLWLLVAIFFEYARPAEFVPGLRALPLNSLIPLLLFALCLVAPGLRPVKQISRDALAKWPLIFLLLIMISVLHAAVTYNAYSVAKTALGYLLLMFMIARIITSTQRLKGLFIVLIVSHLFLLLMNPQVVTDPETRHYIVGGTFLGDGNDFSLSVCILLPMAFGLALCAESTLFRMVWLLIFALMVAAVIGTSSRGGTLGLIAVIGYLWWILPRKMLGVFVLGAAVATAFVYAPDIYFERMSTIVSYQSEGSAMGRITAWKAAVQMAIDHPFLGVGAGHFPIAFGTTYRPAGQETMPWLTAHSMYFLVLGELGLPGIFVLLKMIIGNFLANRSIQRRFEGHWPAKEQANERDRRVLLYCLTASLIGFAVAGAFLSVAYYPHVFVLSGMLVALRCVFADRTDAAKSLRPTGRRHHGRGLLRSSSVRL